MTPCPWGNGRIFSHFNFFGNMRGWGHFLEPSAGAMFRTLAAFSMGDRIWEGIIFAGGFHDYFPA